MRFSDNLGRPAPAINAFHGAGEVLPILFKGGTATFNPAQLLGKLNSPHAAVAVELTNFFYSGIQFDRVSGQ